MTYDLPDVDTDVDAWGFAKVPGQRKLRVGDRVICIAGTGHVMNSKEKIELAGVVGIVTTMESSFLRWQPFEKAKRCPNPRYDGWGTSEGHLRLIEALEYEVRWPG